MNETLIKKKDSGTKTAGRTIRHSLKVAFCCMTALPFFVFAFVYFQIGAFSTALSGALIALALILVLQGFIVFRKMADHIERLSVTMADAGEGKLERIDDTGDTKELALIADTFNRTLSKLEQTARDLGLKAMQASTLNEIREIVSKTIQMEELARLILERSLKSVNAQAGYLAVKKNGSSRLTVAASAGVVFEVAGEIDPDPGRTMAGLVIRRRSPLLVKDIEQEEQWKALNIPDMGLPRLLYLSIAGNDAPMGVLALGRERENPQFEEEDVQFLQTMLQQVAYSLENARLYQNLLQSKKELEIAMEAQKKAQEQLLASARMAAFGELSVNIAHELNNPLTGILGYANLLLDSAAGNKEVQESLEIIQTQAMRATVILRSLLDFVGTGSDSRVSVDLNETVKKVLLLTEGKTSDHGIHIDLKLAEKLPPVLIDQVRMEQVFFSLISNALNAVTGTYGALKGKPSIRIETGQMEGNVYVSFRDNGPGIATEHLSRIFEPFYATQERVSGVGLGLWVSDIIVRTHHGVIRVKSEAGKGSNFIVVLPLSGKV